MRLPTAGQPVDLDLALPLLRRALELGVNYFDSAFAYSNGQSEAALGKAIQGWPREQLCISTKQGIDSSESVAQWRSNLETQLLRLNTPYIDVYHCHNLSWEQFEAYVAPKGGVLGQARKAQAEGLFRHMAFSCHDTVENMLRLIDTGEFDVVTLQYNLLDRANTQVIAHAHECSMGVVVMGSVGGGRLAMSTEVLQPYLPQGYVLKSTPQIALRFVLSNPAVSVALSGMSSLAQLEENVATASRLEALSPDELRQIDEALNEMKRLADLYCTGCGYCLPCPNGVKIPDMFLLMNYFRLYKVEEFARGRYAWMKGMGQGVAEQCIECGQCETKCPQSIPIPERLREVAETLG